MLLLLYGTSSLNVQFKCELLISTISNSFCCCYVRTGLKNKLEMLRTFSGREIMNKNCWALKTKFKFILALTVREKNGRGFFYPQEEF